MKGTKKNEFEKLEFYTVSEAYIKYLSKYDEHIAYNKEESRPYLGSVLIMRENIILYRCFLQNFNIKHIKRILHSLVF